MAEARSIRWLSPRQVQVVSSVALVSRVSLVACHPVARLDARRCRDRGEAKQIGVISSSLS